MDERFGRGYGLNDFEVHPGALGLGAPGQGFPMPWSVSAWLDGENVFDRPIVDLHDAAIELGASSLPCRASVPPAARRRIVAGDEHQR